MNRCLSAALRRRTLAGCCVLAALTPLPNLAQAQAPTDQVLRPFPQQARRGVLRVTNPPEILIDGKPERLSPGARIRGSDNLIVLSNQLVGRDLPVNYTRESLGLVHEVWLLTPDEQARERAGKNAGTQRNFRFSFEAD